MGLPTSERFVAATERELGLALPQWLRERLIQENGGTIEAAQEHWELFAVFDTTDRKHISRSTMNIVRETASARSWAGFPSSAVAIAHNGGGDYLVLLPDGNGAAHLWRHDTGAAPVPVTVSMPGAA